MKAFFQFLASIVVLSSLFCLGNINNDIDTQAPSRIESFTFSNNGIDTKGKVYLPTSYTANNPLPAIYLIDFTEQHFKLATDEFEKVIDGVQRIDGFEALVVSLNSIPDIDAEPETYEEHYRLYKNMAAYVEEKYGNTSSKTLIGKGSESGIVLMTLFQEDPGIALFDNFIATDPSDLYISALSKMIENNNFPKPKSNKKLHFSFSTSNDRARCNKLIKLISEAQYPWLQFQSKEYTNSNYENTYPISFAEGLEYIYIKDE